jgi:hypothetical protein
VGYKWPEEDEKVVLIEKQSSGEYKASKTTVIEHRDIPMLGRAISLLTPVSKNSRAAVLVTLKGEFVGIASSYQGKKNGLIFTRELLVTSGDTDRKEWISWKASVPKNWPSSDEGYYVNGLRNALSDQDESVLILKVLVNAEYIKAQCYCDRIDDSNGIKRPSKIIRVLRLNAKLWEATWA